MTEVDYISSHLQPQRGCFFLSKIGDLSTYFRENFEQVCLFWWIYDDGRYLGVLRNVDSVH